jgi:signal transduction histidine kinase
VADLAAEVGGHLDIDSGKGGGTTLRLEVPLA